MHKYLIIFTILLLTGCASNLPKNIDNAPVPDIKYLQVKENIKQFNGDKVRWGGKIISVENKGQMSRIEILTMPLDSFGEPRQSDEYLGRFLADVNEFIDQEHYKDKTVTIYGTINTSITKPIDEHDYEYPVVNVEEFHIWPKQIRANRYRYYDPFFYPPGFYRFPYYHPFYSYRFRSRFGLYGW